MRFGHSRQDPLGFGGVCGLDAGEGGLNNAAPMSVFLRVAALSTAIWLVSCAGGSVSTLEFVDITPLRPKLGEVTTVRFRVLDYRGLPQGGVSVDFGLQSDNRGVNRV